MTDHPDEVSAAAFDQSGLEQAASDAHAWSWPSAGQFAEAFNSEQMGDFLALATPSAVLDLLARLNAAEEAAEKAKRERDLLSQLLGECVVAAGITHPDAGLSGAQLLMAGDDLKRHLEQASSAMAEQGTRTLKLWSISRIGPRVVVQHRLDGLGYAAAETGTSGIAETVLYRLVSDLINQQAETDQAADGIEAVRLAEAEMQAAQDRLAALIAVAFPADSLVTVRIGTDRKMPCTVRFHDSGRYAGFLRCMPERGKRSRASMRSIHWADVLSVSS